MNFIELHRGLRLSSFLYCKNSDFEGDFPFLDQPIHHTKELLSLDRINPDGDRVSRFGGQVRLG